MEPKGKELIPLSKRFLQKKASKDHFNCPMCNSEEIVFEAEIDGYRFEHCLKCELVFCPQITPQYLSKLYSDGFHGPEDGGPKGGWKKDIRFLDPAFEHLPEDKSLQILDFGTGQDRAPEVLREKGHRVIAVDIVPPLRPHPDRLTGELRDLMLQKEQFDLIFSFQVFEHLPQPRPILDELLRLLKPYGLLLVHTDMETPERDREGFQNWWYAAPPDHCIFYRIKSFRTFLQQRPAEIIWEGLKSVLIRKNRDF